jgi:hypothetical protein
MPKAAQHGRWVCGSAHWREGWRVAYKCRCESCAPDDPGPTYTRAYMRACLVSYVAALPPERAKAFLAAWEEKHKDFELRTETRKAWRANRKNTKRDEK